MNRFFTIRCHALSAAGLIGLAVSALVQGAGANVYLQQYLVSNIPGAAPVTDPNLVDPWGISFSATGPFWVSDRIAGVATIYSGNGAITPTVVSILAAGGAKTPGTPTGQVQNSTTAFLLANGKAASFIFCTDDGTIAAWNTGASAQLMADNSASGAIYKGLALNPSPTAPLIYAANFGTGKIDVFNGTFTATTVPGGFSDPAIPSGFAPFNIWPLGGKLYVTYAKQNATKTLDVAGVGNGYVDVFDFNGNLLSHLISGGSLNSPWGVAIAPAGWGAFGGNLIVGNFGDGTIHAFDVNSGNQLGTLQDQNGNPLAIAGLWALIFGNGGRGGDINTLYFAAGVPNGTSTPRGYLGSIAPPAAITAIFNAAGGEIDAIAPGEIVGIVGQTVGPSPLVSATLPSTGTLSAAALSTTSVTFNGTAAPIIYVGSAQTAVIVPYVIAGSTSASVVLKTGGQTTGAFTIPVAASVPGVFTSNAGGSGAAVALNQDGTVNSSSNPAAKGSVVVLFATGEGATNPPGQDGLISTTDILREPVLPVSLTIGGSTAQVLYAGSSPGNVAGIMEVEAIVPATAASGADPVRLTVGTASSQTNVVISVK
jgi:uncharacterized protein (TIGR03118 family)